jgi:acetolactate synthase-1/2/3 large subunit
LYTVYNKAQPKTCFPCPEESLIVPSAKPGETVAQFVARGVRALGADRVFGLQGGHIQPIWDALAQLDVPVIDARDERGAVHMAHAYGELTGCVAVALVSAGPGVTNTITAVANADCARAPLLVIGGAVPRPQAGKGALQALPQTDLMRPITRYAATANEPDRVPGMLDDAFRAARGDAGSPGPAFLEFPTDVLRAPLSAASIELSIPPAVAPPTDAVQAAVKLLWSARRPLVISGRGGRAAGSALTRLLDATGAAYLDTQESRGLVDDAHPSVVGAVRAQAMRDADLVLTVGRRLDFQLGYGSPAVFPNARFIRIASSPDELYDNRRGDVEIHADPALALDALCDTAANRAPATDAAWVGGLRAEHRARGAKLAATMAAASAGADGFMHPYRLLDAIRNMTDDDTVVIADGGDILSFARIALPASSYLDPGVLGCLGVGVPFAVAAALARPGAKVISINGDGAFGFNALELDTALRHDARAVFVVANNGAWNIEAHDQQVNWQGRLNGSLLRRSDYAMVARGLGLHAERIEDPGALPAALERAFDKAPALLDVLVTRDAVSPDGKSGLAAVPDLQPLASWDAAERALREA